MTENDIRRLNGLSVAVREHIIRMSSDGGCFIGASLSCADLILYLYDKVLNVRPDMLDDPDRDYLLLSKGHDVPALYGTLAELGYIERERLGNHLKTSDSLYWHPNRSVPGVEFHSGSLGHLLSVGIGIALDIRMRGGRNRVFVILGDGELDEGSIWEAALVANSYNLDNLVVVVDRNHFQANVRTEELIRLEPIEMKFHSFGWKATRINGHDFSDMERAFSKIPFWEGSPSAIVADTVRGKGCPSIERRADRWFVNFTRDEVDGLIAELHGEGKATLLSETLMVR